jgi:hypothetical protein
VVRKAQSESADSELIDQAAQTNVSCGIGVPLGKDDNCPLSPPLGAFRKVPRVHDIVCRVRGGDRTRKHQTIVDERVFIGWWQRKKSLARGNRLRSPRRKPLRHIGGVGIEPVDPLQPPFERANHPVFSGGSKFPFPVVKNARDQIRPLNIEY